MNELNIVIPIRCCHALRELKDGERGRLMLGIVNYCVDGREPNFVGYERALWPEFKVAIDEARDREEEIRFARAEGGKLGGRPRKDENLKVFDSPSFPLEPSITPSKKRLSKDNLKESSPASRFLPPTVDEVADYCTQRNNSVDPQTFVDFYESKGWLVGKVKMKDWKAAVRTWERSRGGNNTPLPTEAPQRPQHRFVPTGDYEGYWEKFVDGKWVRAE